MLYWIVWLLPLLILALGIVLVIKSNDDDWAGLVVFGVFALLIAVVINVAVPLNNESTVAEMEAFYQVNYSAYGQTVDQTRAILSVQEFTENAFIGVEGSIEKFQLANQVSYRLAEWRTAVVDYNNTLACYQHFNQNFWLSPYFPDTSGLKFLTIK